MDKIKLTFAREYIDNAVLEDKDLFVFKPPHTFSPDEVEIDTYVAGWSLRVIGHKNGTSRLIARPTNRRTGGVLLAGKRKALMRRFPDVPVEVINNYLKLTKGKSYIWEEHVQVNYFRCVTGHPGPRPKLSPARVKVLEELLTR